MSRKLSAGDRQLRPQIGRPIAFYSYRGFIHDLNEPWDDERCGTYAGVSEHRRLREKLCQPCLDAQSAYVNKWRRRGKCVRGLGWPW